MEDKAKKHKVITLKRAVQLLIFAIVVFLLFGFSASGGAQTASTEIGQPQSPDVSIRSGTTRKGVGRVLIPQSSQANPEDLGKRAHTHHEVFVPAGWQPDQVEPPYAGYAFETPASLACVYHLVTTAAGCNPNTFSTNPTGGSKAIAIVDAFDDPYAAPDLAYFSAQMGLPFSPSQFTVIYESGSPLWLTAAGGGSLRSRWTSNGPTPWHPAPIFTWWRRIPTSFPISRHLSSSPRTWCNAGQQRPALALRAPAKSL